MKRRPKGPRYRNLVKRGGVWYYRRVVGGKRIQRSLKTSDLKRAVARRDLYEAEKNIGRMPFEPIEMPRFGDFAKRYLKEDTSHLAPTTLRERERELKEDGPLVSRLGPLHLDEITEARIREWWNLEVEQSSIGKGDKKRKRSTKTGKNYIDAVSVVLGYARDLGLLETNPARSFREILARKNRTQKGRAESAPGRHIHPIEDPGELDTFVAAARGEDLDAYLFVLLCLDAGLRVSEVLGLRWDHIVWGEGEDDPRRALQICEARPRGGPPGPPKSGRERRVGLSIRLRGMLEVLRRHRESPSGEAHVLPGVEPSNFRHREWSRIVKKAEIGHYNPKDLRDTFGSQLLSAGFPLGYISKQMGHADVAITARHYAKYVSDEYLEAPRLMPGEIPADLLARLGKWYQSGITSDDDAESAGVSVREEWRAQHDSNVRPPGPQPGALSN